MNGTPFMSNDIKLLELELLLRKNTHIPFVLKETNYNINTRDLTSKKTNKQSVSYILNIKINHIKI